MADEQNCAGPVLSSQDMAVRESFTRQIPMALQSMPRTDNVAVAIDATHYCVGSSSVMD